MGRNEPKEFVFVKSQAASPILSTKHEIAAHELASDGAGPLSWFFWYEQNIPHEGCTRQNGPLFLGTVSDEELLDQSGDSDLTEIISTHKESIALLWDFQRKTGSTAFDPSVQSELTFEIDRIEESLRHAQLRTTSLLLQFGGGMTRTIRLREAERLLYKALSELRSAKNDPSELGAAFRSQWMAYNALYSAWRGKEAL
jgi:hypothetical protein